MQAKNALETSPAAWHTVLAAIVATSMWAMNARAAGPELPLSGTARAASATPNLIGKRGPRGIAYDYGHRTHRSPPPRAIHGSSS